MSARSPRASRARHDTRGHRLERRGAVRGERQHVRDVGGACLLARAVRRLTGGHDDVGVGAG